MKNQSIDLRSDTVTLPSPEMRTAMATAILGDDVMQEDPTVNELEQSTAKLLNKQAALFVASGTMGNLVAVLAHCGRGDEIILGRMSHIHIHELGGVSALGGVHTRTVANQPDGTLELAAIQEAINEEDIHHSETRLICLENTWHGRALPLSYMQSVASIASEHGLKVHLDGARIFNAALELGVPASEVARHADSVQLCLSKGLASPVGSMLVGDKDFIKKARRMRKILGGGMRQAGVLAACGLISLKDMVTRLKDDHENAKYMAQELAKVKNIEVQGPFTNMVFIHSRMPGLSNASLADRMNANGVLAYCEQLGIRLVLHYGIDRDHIDQAVERIAACTIAQQAHVR